MLGIFLGQVILYGPSLIGSRVLLPLGTLGAPGVYLPRSTNEDPIDRKSWAYADLVLYQEPERVFAHREIFAGRFPLWSPYRFGGNPNYPLSFSPAWVLAYLFESPVVLAWTQMTIALIAGTGAYVFFRRVLGVSFWPAVIAAWCYPITGAYIVWIGFWLPAVMCWLGWMLTATDRAIRNPRGWGGPGLAAVTAVALVSGAQDVAGQLLFVAGIYAIWCFIDHYGFDWLSRPALRAVAAPALGWTIGIAASAWLILPFHEYVGTGSRMVARGHGQEERPPIGISALPQIVFPELYGANRFGNFRYATDLFPESMVAGYAGLIALMFVAPLAWCSRMHRSINIFWIVLCFIAMSWMLNVPGMVQLLRLPGFNMMSHNRLPFVIAFAILAMVAVGLDVLWREPIAWRNWFFVPILLLLLTGFWFAFRAINLPEPIATQLGNMLKSGYTIQGIRDLSDMEMIRSNFRATHAIATLLAVVALAWWISLLIKGTFTSVSRVVLCTILIGDLLWFGYGRAAQHDPANYYPSIPVVEAIAKRPPGRIIGFDCFPPNLGQMCGLLDIRGYDGVDPDRMVELLKLTSRPQATMPPYAVTQWLQPLIVYSVEQWRTSPILDMLNVRYLIFRGSPPPHLKPVIAAQDYWVLNNSNALPRVFVPAEVELIADGKERLAKLSSWEFDPRAMAYVEVPVSLPEQCAGTGTIEREIPTQIDVSLDMKTTGLVVLSDAWDKGWNAYLNGTRVPIYRTNHAVRGVVAPAGQGRLEFRYEPQSLYRGMQLSGLAALGWAVWAVVLIRRARNRAPGGTTISKMTQNYERAEIIPCRGVVARLK